ncbi:hypothetical protein [Streptomyces antibioticus]|uniref:Uncharacterized protein n=1 Tax=Streptomyces antibioticus TaxID=1890 RepID=A0AAE6YEK2_STRAT|nr:hypothetical protein [Streptomyces antibioticus]OOQ47918.1 hypothetical protein AFM16_35310 [Streptomyces antibioticus]QIT48253.1 hypothetical protein HCX60_35900 [Streptomyces antibioticus]
MRPAPRAVPTAAARLAVLLAVLLALVPGVSAPAAPDLSGAGAGAGAGAGTGVAVATAVDSGPRADDACATGCPAQARVRHDHGGERPSAPDHPVTTTRTPVVAPAAGAPASARAAHPSVSPGRTAHDRGRAPPTPTGT